MQTTGRCGIGKGLACWKLKLAPIVSCPFFCPQREFWHSVAQTLDWEISYSRPMRVCIDERCMVGDTGFDS